MSNEKIKKLLLSPNHEDFLIALEFLKEKSIEEISSILQIPTKIDLQSDGLTVWYLDNIDRKDREYKINESLYLFSANKWLDFHNKPIKNIDYIKL